jgi:hypothetical protein
VLIDPCEQFPELAFFLGPEVLDAVFALLFSKLKSKTSTPPSPRAAAISLPASPGMSPSVTDKECTKGGLQIWPTPSLLMLTVEAVYHNQNKVMTADSMNIWEEMLCPPTR